MSSSLFHVLNISRQDMLSKLQDLDVVSNNIANLNVKGYKSNRSNFQEMLEGLNLEGTQLSSSQLQMIQGNIYQSGNPLDLAIQGDGFFGITIATGKTGYTRDGQFVLDANNRIVTPDGLPLVWTGTIPLDAQEIAVQPEGEVRVRIGDVWNVAGTISLSRFPNASALQNNGNNILLETEASGKAITGAPMTTNFGSILAGAVEQSNVNLSQELTHLITLQREFEMSTKTFQTTDEMIMQALQMRRG
jgi:flagellar basal-body rod protein FlgG